MSAALNLLDLAALCPLFLLLGGALVLLLVESFSISAKKYTFFLTLGTLITAGIANFLAPASESPLLTPWLRFDPLSMRFTAMFIAIGIASLFLAKAFFLRFESTDGEYYFLLLSSLIGLILIGMAADFLTLFIGLETLSIALYILCGYVKKWELSHEAMIKYFLMGSLGAAFLLYGIAFIYGATGTTRLDLLLNAYQTHLSENGKTLFLSGIAFVTVGLCFKAAVVPFHTWAPDVYDGAPTPVTAFMAVGTKTGAFAALAILFMWALPRFDPLWNQGVAFLAYLTLIYANMVALRQESLRRFFAYSGISHAGFMLIALVANTPQALIALTFYLIVYAIATFGAFSTLAFLDEKSKGVFLEDLRGLFYRCPWLACFFSFYLLTLGGIPPTVGFLAKFYLFKVGFQEGYYGLVMVALLTTILSAFYYLRIIFLLFSEPSVKQEHIANSWPAFFVAWVTFFLLLFLSIFPSFLLENIQKP